MPKHALIAGVSGIIGRHTAEELLQQGGWEVSGISRHPSNLPKGVKHVGADLLDAKALKTALAPVEPTHVFITTWSRQANWNATSLVWTEGGWELALSSSSPDGVSPALDRSTMLAFAADLAAGAGAGG